MNTVDIDTELENLGRLLKTNVELLETGVISKKHYNHNKKIIADRIATLADTFLKAVR